MHAFAGRSDGIGVFASDEDRAAAPSTPIGTRYPSRAMLDEGESWDLFLRIKSDWADLQLIIGAETPLGPEQYQVPIPLPSPPRTEIAEEPNL